MVIWYIYICDDLCLYLWLYSMGGYKATTKPLVYEFLRVYTLRYWNIAINPPYIELVAIKTSI